MGSLVFDKTSLAFKHTNFVVDKSWLSNFHDFFLVLSLCSKTDDIKDTNV